MRPAGATSERSREPDRGPRSRSQRANAALPDGSSPRGKSATSHPPKAPLPPRCRGRWWQCPAPVPADRARHRSAPRRRIDHQSRRQQRRRTGRQAREQGHGTTPIESAIAAGGVRADPASADGDGRGGAAAQPPQPSPQAVFWLSLRRRGDDSLAAATGAAAGPGWAERARTCGTRT